MKVAICYFGLLRTLKKVLDTHEEYLFKVLWKHNIEVDIFVHTWYGSLVHRRGNDANLYENDAEDYTLLQPLKAKVDNQDEYISTLQFGDYFYKDIFEKYGESRQTEWFPDLILFHLCSLESQRRVVELVKESNNKYDKILMLRPDLQFKKPFPIEPFLDVSEKAVYIPDSDEGEGYNDRLALFNASEIEPYAERILKIKEFRAKVGRIVGEKYLKYTLDMNGFEVKPFSIETPILRV